MQPRILLGSTFALVMGVSGLAYAEGGDSKPGGSVNQPPRDAVQTTTATRAATHAEIKSMQKALTARNLYQGPADGVWGPKTESALRNFQTQNGLESTGTLNEPTARALGIDRAVEVDRQMVKGTDPNAAPVVAGAAQPQAPAAPDSSTNVQLSSLSQEQAREMQQRLQLLGYYRGDIDGRVGEGTRAALQRYFQSQAELARQGLVSNSAIGQFGTAPKDVPR